jgi:hypothetical protein
MGCGCKKGKLTLMADHSKADGNPDTWGPAVWSIFHIIACRIGKSGIDTDQIREMEFVLGHLPTVLPCPTCQGHMRSYLVTYPFQCDKLRGEELCTYARTWMMNFHNAVRGSKGQTIDIMTLEKHSDLYASESIQECHINTLVGNVTYGIRNGIIKIDAWKRWIPHFNRLKVMIGQ